MSDLLVISLGLAVLMAMDYCIYRVAIKRGAYIGLIGGVVGIVLTVRAIREWYAQGRRGR